MALVVNKQKKFKNKNSSGIICSRYNAKNGEVEFILVCKRLTHEFTDFVMGFSDNYDFKKVQRLLNGMTTEEKIEILFMNFDKLWDKLWLKSNIHNELEKYAFHKKRYENFLIKIGEARLRNMISNSSNSFVKWEIPKGRIEKTETAIVTAYREFNEETGISPLDYEIIDKSYKNTIVDNNVCYNSVYFLAVANQNIQLNKKYLNIFQNMEITDCRWFNVKELKGINVGTDVRTILTEAEHFLRKEYHILRAQIL